jgi:hypothetical protein
VPENFSTPQYLRAAFFWWRNFAKKLNCFLKELNPNQKRISLSPNIHPYLTNIHPFEHSFTHLNIMSSICDNFIQNIDESATLIVSLVPPVFDRRKITEKSLLGRLGDKYLWEENLMSLFQYRY